MNNIIEAVCVLNNKEENINGVIIFKENKEKKCVDIKINITGLEEGLHGFHIHETGDLREGCGSLCRHYNPKNKNHGGPLSKERHIGDLGNVKANKNKIVNMRMSDKLIKLRGKYSIIGRSVVIHEKEDDLGLGNNKESLITGNAGKRIVCGIIGYSKNNIC